MSQTILKGKSDKFICVFLSKVSDRPISPQSGEGDMHEVPSLRTKVVRGFQEFSHHWTKARITKTARTPTDKSVWGISEDSQSAFHSSHQTQLHLF